MKAEVGNQIWRPLTGSRYGKHNTPTSHSIQTSPIVFLDLENVGLAVEISLLSCIQTTMLVYVIRTYFRFMAAILISGWITVISCTSSKSYLDALPFGENRMKNIPTRSE